MRPSFRHEFATRLSHAIGSVRARVAFKMPSAAEIAPGIWIGHQVTGIRNVAFGGANVVGRGTAFQGIDIVIGRGTTLGFGCVLNGPLEIGNFCQFGSYVGVYSADHPVDVAVPNINRGFIDGRVRKLGTVADVRIGHGCWIGHGAVVLRGVSLGNGCVVGAGSVVRQDVPPYCVVTGVPAGEPRPRFAKDLAVALDQIRWWEWPDEALAARSNLFLTSFRDDPDTARRLLAGLR